MIDPKDFIPPSQKELSENPRFGHVRLWHVPQVPGPAFHWYFGDIKLGAVVLAQRMCDALAAYDAFQYANRIKPDYSNASGVEVFSYDPDGDLETEGEWEEFDFDFPVEDWWRDHDYHLSHARAQRRVQTLKAKPEQATTSPTGRATTGASLSPETSDRLLTSSRSMEQFALRGPSFLNLLLNQTDPGSLPSREVDRLASLELLRDYILLSRFESWDQQRNAIAQLEAFHRDLGRPTMEKFRIEVLKEFQDQSQAPDGEAPVIPSAWEVSKLTPEMYDADRHTFPMLKQGRIIIGVDRQQGEGIYTLVVPADLMHDGLEAHMLNNTPLNEGYRPFDLVRPRSPGSEAYDVVGRVFPGALGFMFQVEDTPEARMDLMQRLRARLAPINAICAVSFTRLGRGIVWTTAAPLTDAYTQVASAILAEGCSLFESA